MTWSHENESNNRKCPILEGSLDNEKTQIWPLKDALQNSSIKCVLHYQEER
ncbi:unnamed protein product [Amaranthus hypochondriacus]